MRPSRPVLIALLSSLALAASVILPLPPTAAQQAQQIYHGNVRSHIYHRQGCRYFDCAMCTAVFQTRQAAEAAGYRGCKVCRP